MRPLLIILFLIHGIFHLPGFLNGFQLLDPATITLTVSKSMAVFWLLTSLLFFMSSIVYGLKKKAWFVLALVALVCSQILIFLHWQDTQWGTLVNGLLLVCVLIAFSNWLLERKWALEQQQFQESLKAQNLSSLGPDDVIHLPIVVQHWLMRAGVVGKPVTFGLRLCQKGQMKTKPSSRWLPFTAEQYFNTQPPAFHWTAEVAMGFGLFLKGRDAFKEGEGEMLIKLAALFPVVNEKHTPQINTGSMIRYLAEICWFPSAAISPYINWEPRDAFSAKATFTQKGITVTGIFRFTEKGDLQSFEAERYFGGNNKAKKYPWMVTVLDYMEKDKVRVPKQCSVTWKLPEGDFEWLRFSVTSLEFNPA